MLSSEKCKAEIISLRMNKLSQSSEKDQKELRKLIQGLPIDFILLNELNLSHCELTDDTFFPIVGALKFVKKITLMENKLTFTSLLSIFKV